MFTSTSKLQRKSALTFAIVVSALMALMLGSGIIVERGGKVAQGIIVERHGRPVAQGVIVDRRP